MNTAIASSEQIDQYPSHTTRGQLPRKTKWLLAFLSCIAMATAAAFFYTGLFAQTPNEPADSDPNQFRSVAAESCPLRVPKNTTGINTIVTFRHMQTGEKPSRAIAVTASLNDELHDDWMVYGLDVFPEAETEHTPLSFLTLSNELPEVSQRRAVQFEVFQVDPEVDYRLVFLLLPRGHQEDIDGAIRELKNGGLTVDFRDLGQSQWAFSDLP